MKCSEYPLVSCQGRQGVSCQGRQGVRGSERCSWPQKGGLSILASLSE